MGKSLTWLSDAEWMRIEPLLPKGDAARGVSTIGG